MIVAIKTINDRVDKKRAMIQSNELNIKCNGQITHANHINQVLRRVRE
jgi:hypothetical protein